MVSFILKLIKNLSMGLIILLLLLPFTCTDLKEQQTVESKKLNQIFEGYFEDLIRLFPIYASYIGDKRYDDKFANDISEEHRNQQKELANKYLNKISEVDRNLLQGQDKLSYDIFKEDMLLYVEGLQYNDHLMPISQFSSWPSFFAELGSGSSLHPFKTVMDYDNFLERVKGFQTWVDTAIANMRKGIEVGIVQPKILMEKFLPQAEAQVVNDIKESIFFRPIKNFPNDFSEKDKIRLTQAYSVMIEKQIIPTYKKLYNFIKEEYIPRCRETIGFSDLPDGEKWYAFQVKTQTTTDLTPEEIFQIGMSEVKRIKGEMELVKKQTGFKGDLKSFFEYLRRDPKFYYNTEEELLDGYEKIRKRVDPELPKLFGFIPKVNYEIKPVEEYIAKSEAAARYMGPSEDGSRLGIFYVNTYDLKARPIYDMESLSLHEASPGHHFQISLQQGQQDLPKFRRFGGYTAYVEGWALYAESLGKELGLYTDPYQHFGKLSNEILRATRLVVDVGMHSKEWTREEALKFMLENCAITETDAIAEIERYIAWPGQALAYKIGQLKISALRLKAEEKLGAKFDIITFHDEVLKDGALPLDVLEIKMDEWIDSINN